MATAQILCVGKLSAAGYDWRVTPPAMLEPVTDDDVEATINGLFAQTPPDGELWRLIDEGEQTAEYEDWLEDVEWMRRGM